MFGILIAILISICIYLHNKLEIVNQNFAVSKAQVEQLILENGEIITIRDSYISSYKEVKEQLELSNKEIQVLKRKLGEKPKVVTTIETIVKYDTIQPIQLIKPNLFTYQDDWVSFSLDTEKPLLMNLSVNAPLKVGMTENKVFVYSDNPYLNISSIENHVRKPSRWSWGIQIGFGFNYGLFHRGFDFGPYMGLGIEYKF